MTFMIHASNKYQIFCQKLNPWITGKFKTDLCKAIFLIQARQKACQDFYADTETEKPGA